MATQQLVATPATFTHFPNAKHRREHMRWLLLLAIDKRRPQPTADSDLLATIRSEFHDVTLNELRRELDYLRVRGLLTITPSSTYWIPSLTYQGIDLVEYTSADIPGIDRPTHW